MNKKGMFPIFTILFIDVVFVFIWIYFLSDLLTLAGNMYIGTGAVGFERFFYGNLNFLVFIVFLIFNAGSLYLGGRD